MVRGWDGEGMLGNSLRRAEDPGLSPTSNHSPGTQLVGGSSWMPMVAMMVMTIAINYVIYTIR